MLTRVFLAAGVAALAIAAPAGAEKGGKGGGQGGQAASVDRSGGGGQRAQSLERRGGGGGISAQRVQRVERQQFKAPRVERQQRFAAFQRPERADRTERRADRQVQRAERPSRVERQTQRAPRVERQAQRIERQAQRMERPNRIDRAQARAVKELRTDKVQRAENRVAQGQALRVRELEGGDRLRIVQSNNALGWGVGGCPPGLLSKGCEPPGQTLKTQRLLNADAFRFSRLATLAAGQQLLAPAQVIPFVGSPLSTVANIVALNALPSTVSYLYPDTDDYYYRYGGGYLYRVERDNDLIDWILPLIAGGFMPGQYLPSSYMSSYVPAQYGFNSFYPDSPYDCNRYVNGVIYEVDCMTGVVEDVIPLYASGYGVGQYLPSAYSYYNVPLQYRDLYYPTNDYSYWYAPGAIYQYDPSSSLITSVAALLSPGFTIGQPLPAGYGVYNVPLGYRSTYYDTPNAWYRYNNGYIYQVDPTTQLVTAIVASILT
jgi:hypothetical protein